jgi:hypothetical protein
MTSLTVLSSVVENLNNFLSTQADLVKKGNYSDFVKTYKDKSTVTINIQEGQHNNEDRSYFFVNVFIDQINHRMNLIIDAAQSDSPRMYNVTPDTDVEQLTKSVLSDFDVMLNYIRQFGSTKDLNNDITIHRSMS